MRKLLLFVVLCGCLLAALPAVADNTIVIGLPPDPAQGNCFPFGCAYTTNYQQVYTSSVFTGGPILITGLEFFNTQVDDGATGMNSGLWTISLSTSSHDWNTLSPTFSQNLGPDNTQVFSGDLSQPWSFGDTLVINLTTPFMYDPSKGNLLMSIAASGTSDNLGLIFFDTNGYNGGGDNGNTIMGRDYCNGCGQDSGNVDSGFGLVTGFITGSNPTPEPSSFLLLSTGLAGLGVLRRKFRL